MSEKALTQKDPATVRKDRPGRGFKREMEGALENEKLTVVNLTRTAKVVKGGKRFSFRALVVVGDTNGSVGVSIGKANQVQLAIQKAASHARKHMGKYPIINNTIPHETTGKFGTGSVWMKPAAPGTGGIAGGGVRAVLEAAGVQNVLTKNIGSSNPFNMVYATCEALKTLRTKEQVARMRGKGEGAAKETTTPAAQPSAN